MLQHIREWSQGFIAWVLVLLICISFALWGVHAYIEGGGPSTTAATVNGVDISQRQLHAAYQRLQQQEQMRLGTAFINNPGLEKQFKQQALQQLILNEILFQAAIKQGFRFHPDQVVAAVQSIPAFKVKGQFSSARFREVLNNIGFSEAEFLINLQSALLINQLRTGLLASAFALPSEIDETIQLVSQKRDIAYLMIPQSRFFKNTDIPPQAIQDYYHQHEQQFLTSERVSLEYIEVSLDDLKKHISIDEKELKQFYYDNINQFSKSTMASSGRNVEVQSFNKIKPQVEKAFLQQKLEQRYAEIIEDLANHTYAHPKSLKPASEALSLSIKSTGLFDRQGSTEVLARNPKILAAAFKREVLDFGDNSEVIELDPQHAMVIRVKEHQPSKLKPLKEVNDEIKQRLIQAKAKQQAEQLAKEIARQVQKGSSTNELAAKYQLKWQQSNNVGRYDKQLNSLKIRGRRISTHEVRPEGENQGWFSLILSQAFHLQKPAPGRPSPAAAFSLPNGDAVIIKLIGVHDGNSTHLSVQQRQVYQEQIKQGLGQLDYQHYVNGLFKQSKIKVKEKEVEEIEE